MCLSNLKPKDSLNKKLQGATYLRTISLTYTCKILDILVKTAKIVKTNLS